MSSRLARRDPTPGAASFAFRFRLGTAMDLSRCAALLHPGLRIPSDIRERLPELWGDLLREGSLRAAVVEDLEQPDRVEAFGFSVFVSDEFIGDFLARPKPYLSVAIYQSILAGKSAVLTPRQIRAANATTGLHLVPIHAGLRHWELSHPRTMQVMPALSVGFFFLHTGYNIKTLVGEVHGEDYSRFVRLGGYRIIQDFRRERPENFADVPSTDSPYLAMACKDWLEPAANNPLTQLFMSPRPRIGFSTTQQRLLEHALMGETDSRIANLLNVSSDRVKKVWRDIHEKTQREMPFLVPKQEHSRDGVRGQSRRRQLLDYLRMHMEELRPFNRAVSNPKLDGR